MLKGNFQIDLLRPGARFLQGFGVATLAFAVAGVAAMAASPPQSGPAQYGSPAWFIWQPPANAAPRPPQAQSQMPQRIAQCAAEFGQVLLGSAE